MHTAIISKWGNSQGIRIPAEIMKEKKLNIGDQITFSISDSDSIVIEIPRNPRKKLKAAGILHEYAKGKPDLEAEQRAIEEAIIEKYSKAGS